MPHAYKNPWQAALEWQIEQGADEALSEAPRDHTKITMKAEKAVSVAAAAVRAAAPVPGERSEIMGAVGARAEALKLARACATLDELREAIAAFDGLAIRKTATNMVFCDGNPKAPVMLIGEAPGADEDRLGKPFVGVSGQLLDKILGWIDLSRKEEDPAKAIYISNILNWRPPGNRTPSPAEIEISLPFIERHIALVKPKVLILCGGVSTKALMNRPEGISKLRGLFHAYVPQTPGIMEPAEPIPALATYHPAYLLRTPSQKQAVWSDMLLLQQKLRETGRI